jgi:hypothetical protein
VSATIYFSGSITGGRHDVALYRRIVEALENDGHRVLAGSVIAQEIDAGGEALSAAEIFSRDLAWIAEADVLVAEVSTPSLGVGYEIAAARYRYDISVICLYRAGRTSRCSAMISGDPGIRLLEYTDDSVDDLVTRLSRALRE